MLLLDDEGAARWVQFVGPGVFLLGLGPDASVDVRAETVVHVNAGVLTMTEHVRRNVVGPSAPQSAVAQRPRT